MESRTSKEKCNKADDGWPYFSYMRKNTGTKTSINLDVTMVFYGVVASTSRFSQKRCRPVNLLAVHVSSWRILTLNFIQKTIVSLLAK